MKKFLTLLIALGFLIISGNYALAEDNFSTERQGHFKNRKEKRQEHRKHFKKKRQEVKERLHLTEEQKTRARAIHEEARPKIKPIVEKIRAKKREIIEMKQSGATREEMHQKIREIKSLISEANEIREENIKKFESILDAQQKAEFEKIKAEVKEKREQMRSKMHERMNNRLHPEHMEME